jgi:hypothetical protein
MELLDVVCDCKCFVIHVCECLSVSVGVVVCLIGVLPVSCALESDSVMVPASLSDPEEDNDKLLSFQSPLPLTSHVISCGRMTPL